MIQAEDRCLLTELPRRPHLVRIFKWCEGRVQFYTFAYGSPFVTAAFVGRSLVSPLNDLDPLVKCIRLTQS